MASNKPDQISERKKYIQQIESYKKELKDKFIFIREEMNKIETENIAEFDEILSSLNDPNNPDYISQVRQVCVSWNDGDLRNCISSLCTVEQAPLPVIREQVWTSAKRGSDADNIFRPHGLTIDSETNEIYISDCYNSRIQVFTCEGKHSRTLKHSEIFNVHRILCAGLHLYVTDPINKHIYKINKSNGELLLSEELEFTPGGLDISNGVTYIADFKMMCLYRYDEELYQESTFVLKFAADANNDETRLLDIKFFQDCIYTLLENTNFKVNTFDLEGNLIACLVPTSIVMKAFYFCVDKNQNILISSWEDNQVIVFTSKGKPILRIGNSVRADKDCLVHPRGIGLLNTGVLVVCDNKDSTCLHSYVYI